MAEYITNRQKQKNLVSVTPGKTYLLNHMRFTEALRNHKVKTTNYFPSLGSEKTFV